MVMNKCYDHTCNFPADKNLDLLQLTDPTVVFFWAVDARKLLWIESCEMDVLVGFDILFIPFSVLGYKTK